ncbi:hypothetical protein FQR65_LT10141 [Abscondita terminalis]|nr:hypothetical protein FQR65_LT10141 [Abscondita terminalis]
MDFINCSFLTKHISVSQDDESMICTRLLRHNKHMDSPTYINCLQRVLLKFLSSLSDYKIHLCSKFTEVSYIPLFTAARKY